MMYVSNPTVGAERAGMNMEMLALANRNRGGTNRKKRLRLGGQPMTAERLKMYSEEMPSGCWEWRYVMNNGQSPQVSIDRKMVSAKRLMWELASGVKLESRKQMVFMKCGNKKCINPGHMNLGDAGEHARRYGFGNEELKRRAREMLMASVAKRRAEREARKIGAKVAMMKYAPTTRFVAAELEALGVSADVEKIEEEMKNETSVR